VGIVFSRAWEDDRLDLALLAAPGQRVLVVAAAGDAGLALAAGGASVTAVDLNPEQLRLAALKAAAAWTLDPTTLRRWFEAGRDPDAAAIYRERVRPALDDAGLSYWDEHIGIVAAGLHDHGVGRPFRQVGRLARILIPDMPRRIEGFSCPADQAAWWRRRVRPVLFGPLTHAVARHTRVLAPLAPHPDELARMRTGDWTRRLVARVDSVVAQCLVRDHPWWRPAFSGRAAADGSGAAWLDDDALVALRSVPPPILVEGDLASAVRADAGTFASISLSNVPDWLDEPAIADLAAASAHALAPGGRLLVRRVVTPVGSDAFVAAGLVVDPVSEGLAARDRTALYESVVLYRRPQAQVQ
jgi:S-adenosylmethionine:diacylglycerol 3-amino-3-carboxypropyl transferase